MDTQETKKYSIGVRIWLREEAGHFVGAGRVKLLEQIKLTGSITGASKAMEMSYRQAWQIVEDMNKHSTKPLVEKKLGGKGGGGARITEAGEKVIELFYRLEQEFNAKAEELAKEIVF